MRDKKPDAFEIVPPFKTRKGWTPPPDAVYKAGKKKERATKAANLLELVVADAAGYRQNLALILQGQQVVKLLREYRKNLDIL